MQSLTRRPAGKAGAGRAHSRRRSAGVRPPRASRQKNAAAATPTSDRQVEDNPFTVGLVAVLTETLRLLGVGRARFDEAEAAPSLPRPRRGDVDAVRRRVALDFERAYFVLGQLDDGVYDPDCRFADPTVAFRGVRLWRRNLALLTPFLVDPRIDLLPPAPEDGDGADATGGRPLSLGRMPSLLLGGLRLFGGGGGGGADDPATKKIVRLGRVGPAGEEVLRARWYLETRLRLPWRPLIRVTGATDYTLDLEERNRVVDHVESWEISGTEALLQLFRPGPKLGGVEDGGGGGGRATG